MQLEITKGFLQEIKKAIDTQDVTFLKSQLEEIHAVDLSSLVVEFEPKDAKFVLTILDIDTASEVLSNLEDDYREELLTFFNPSEIATYLKHVETDDAADILNDQSEEKRDEIIALIDDKEQAQNITDLLRYEEDTAGGLMAKEMIVANVNWNVRRTIEEIRRQREEVEKIHAIYVVDDESRLIGRVSLKRIILASDEAYIEDLYDKEIVSVSTFDSQDEVARVMSKYDLTAIPVVNVHNQLVGRIEIDDIVDVIKEQAEIDIQMMAGISESVEQDDSIWALTRARLPWLLVGLLGGLIGARLISGYEDQLKVIPAVAFFIPLIMGTGGNVGIQSSTIVVQSLANQTGLEENLFRSLFKSFIVAIINGLVIAGIASMVNYFVTSNIEISMVVGIALMSVVMLATIMGTITPLVLDKIGVNPAMASGPFITTANDLLGILVYFSVAKLFLM